MYLFSIPHSEFFAPFPIMMMGIVGLSIGSFLNVLIKRIPIKLLTIAPHPLPFRSCCPHCHTLIRARDNIPVLSFLLLKARCRSCKEKISVQYPLVEILTAFISVFIVLKFDRPEVILGLLLFTWILITLSFIDIQHLILPDKLTLPLLLLGLGFNFFQVFHSFTDALIGAVSGFLLLWFIYWIYKIFRKQEGLGFGDFKLFSALGAWVGWQALPFVLGTASILGGLFGLTLMFLGKATRNTALPFGPFLAFGGFLFLVFEQDLLRLYLYY